MRKNRKERSGGESKNGCVVSKQQLTGAHWYHTLLTVEKNFATYWILHTREGIIEVGSMTKDVKVVENV